MKKILAGRGMGKTYQLICESGASGAYIVCRDRNEVFRIAEEAHKLNITIPFPITFDEFLSKKYYGKGISGFLIDNADRLLQMLTPVQIKTITMNVE